MIITSLISGFLLISPPKPAGHTCDLSAHRAWERVCLTAAFSSHSGPTQDWEMTGSQFPVGTPPFFDFVTTCQIHLRDAESPGHAALKIADADLGASRRCTDEEHLAWLQECLSDVQQIQIDMRREDLPKDFYPEGGLQGLDSHSYIHRRCDILHVRLSFGLVTRGDWTVSGDTVVSVATYVGAFIAD